MSQERYRYSRQSNYRRAPTGRFPTRRIRTIGPEPERRIWPLIVLIVLELLFLLSMVALWLWPYFAMPNYVGLNGNMVAQVQISSTRKPQLIHVQLTLFNEKHNPTRVINCYMMQGDRLVLQGDILIFTSWQNSIGRHSGFKLTQLVGCYGDTTFKGSDIISDLNGGEDGFFGMAQGQTWYSELLQVQAYYYKSRPLLANLPVDQKIETFNVVTSPTGLYVMQPNRN